MTSVTFDTRRAVRGVTARVRDSAGVGNVAQILAREYERAKDGEESVKFCLDELHEIRQELRKTLSELRDGDGADSDIGYLSFIKKDRLQGLLSEIGDSNRSESPVSDAQPSVKFTIPALDISSVKKDNLPDDVNERSYLDLEVIPEPAEPAVSLLSDSSRLDRFFEVNSNSDKSMGRVASPLSDSIDVHEVTDSSSGLSELAEKLTDDVLRNYREMKRGEVGLTTPKNTGNANWKSIDFTGQGKSGTSSRNVIQSGVPEIVLFRSTPIERKEENTTFIKSKETAVQTNDYEKEPEQAPGRTAQVAEVETMVGSSLDEGSSESFNHSSKSSGQIRCSNAVEIVNVRPDGAINMSQETDSQRSPPARPAKTSTPSLTPRVSESPWRPSIRQLRISAYDIESSVASEEIETVSAIRNSPGSSHAPRSLSKDSLEEEYSSHADDSTYNQISNISSTPSR